MLEVEHVGIRFGDVDALAEVSLSVRDGERLAVLGPSGSGKSTLLRAIAGLEPLAAGRIAWNGEDLAGVSTHARKFGLMFQDYALFPHRDVAGNVRFGLEMEGWSRSDAAARTAEVLELVGLEGFARRPVNRLSGGEQQRVALARALAPRPRLLMLDEPLGALDRTLRERLLDDLLDLFRRVAISIIYVTHDQDEALAVGDNVAVLRAGRLEAVGRPRDIWLKPPTEFVARFLGLTNIADATVNADGQALTAWGRLAVPAGTPVGRQRMLIRPEHVAIDAAGELSGTVRSITFRGAQTLVDIAMNDAPSIELHQQPDARVPEIGESVRLAIAAAGVQMLSPADQD